MYQRILAGIFLIVLATTLGSSRPPASYSNRNTSGTACACDGDENFSISCTNNQRILILDAFYGRLVNETCNNGNEPNYGRWKFPCRSNKSTEVVSTTCNNQSACSIENNKFNKLFGDPCSGTKKYLLVNYTCIPAYLPFEYTTAQTAQTTTKSTEGSCQCQNETRRKVVWPTTNCSSLSQNLTCPNNPRRTEAERWCSTDGSWSQPNLVRCITEEIERMGKELESLKANFTVSVANEMMKGVKNISESEDLYGGDLYELSKVMIALIEISLNNSKRFNASEAEDISALTLDSTSNLLSDEYDETWNDLPPYNQSQTATRLLEAMEESSAIWAGATKNCSHRRKTDTEIDELEIDVINITEAKLHQPSITFNASGLHVNISLEDVELRASNDGLGRVDFILYDDIEKRLTSSESIRDVENTTAANGTYFEPFIITKVVSASIVSDKEPLTDLRNPIQFTLKHKSPKVNESELKCVFWKFSKHDFVGQWSDKGCKVVSFNEYNTTCECTHLTNFAVLMSASKKPLSATHLFVLQVITNIGCAISIVCLALALFVFCFFRNLQSDRNTIHKNLVLSLLIAQLIFVFGITQYKHEDLCAVVAGFLHFFFLASFAWMCLEGVQLYVLLIEVFEIEKSRVKWYYLGGYGIPALIVLISACANINIRSDEYRHGGYGEKGKHCFLNQERNFIWAFIGPVLAVLAVNLVMLGLAIYMMCKHASAASWKLKEKSKFYKMGSWLRGAAILVVLLGTTWTFGILLVFDNGTVAFEYIFTILNSLQGLFIFVFHCLTNDKVKKEYQRAVERTTWIPKCFWVKCEDYEGNGALVTPNHSTASGKTLLQKMFPKNKRKQSVSSCSSQQMLDRTSSDKSTSSDSRRGHLVIFSSPQDKEWPSHINTVSESVHVTDSSGFSSYDSDVGKSTSTELSSEYSEPFSAGVNENRFNV